jgi:hypothetical protein
MLYAMLWRDGEAVELAGPNSTADLIADNAVVAGQRVVAGQPGVMGFLWASAAEGPIDLSSPDGNSTEATALNETGLVAGYSYEHGGTGSWRVLLPLGGRVTNLRVSSQCVSQFWQASLVQSRLDHGKRKRSSANLRG